MKINNFLKLFTLTLISGLFYNELLFSYINQATIWKKWNANLNSFTYVMTCADCHANFFPENNSLVNTQIQAIKKLICSANNSIFFLVEDMTHYQTETQQENIQDIKAYLPKTNTYQESSEDKVSLLSGITDYILKFGKNESITHTVKNLECRFYVNLLKNVFSHEILESNQSDNFFKISGQEIIKNFDIKYKRFKELFENQRNASVRTLEIYKNFYDQIIREAKDGNDYAKIVSSDSFFLKEYMENNSDELFKIFSKISTCCFRFIDLSVMEEILSNENKEKIFIITGGAHTYNIDIFLEQVGYTKIAQHGERAFKEKFDGKPIFGSNIFSKNEEDEEQDFQSICESQKEINPIDLDLIFNLFDNL